MTTSGAPSNKVRYEVDGAVVTVTIDRPAVRNAVDAETAGALADCFSRFDADENLNAAVLTGAGGNFCAGFDLKAIASGSRTRLVETGQGPMGPTRMTLGKPVIAAIEGHAVAGGLELALWCDLRVAAGNATLGVFNRRFGVPLIDLGTVRLPRLIGQGRALDMILTGRPVAADEALRIGLVERVVEPGQALAEAQKVARDIAAFPQSALRGDRWSLLNQWSMSLDDAMRAEYKAGVEAMASGEATIGARRFAEGSGRHGSSG
jgi:enoyl-CoA hydratase